MFLRIVYPIIYAFIWLFFPFKIIGRENVPDEAALICPNHSSYLDPVYVFFVLGRKAYPKIIAKKELFRFPVFRTVIKWLGAFPVARDGSDISALKNCMRLLSNGQKLIIFPEGTRVRNDKQGGAKGGAGMLAVRASCPVLPIYIPVEKKIFRRTTVIVGQPFVIKKTESRPSKEDYEAASSEIYERIFALKESR